MKSKPTPSSFLLAAQQLDGCFQELENLAGSIGRLELNSEASLERARVLLTRFTTASESLASALVQLGQSLDDRRRGADAAVAMVDAQASIIQAAFAQAEAKVERFNALGIKVRELTSAATRLGVADTRLALRDLADEAEQIHQEARQSNLRTLETNAKQLRQSLRELDAKLADNI